MVKRVLVIEQDSYELLNEMMKDLAVKMLSRPVGDPQDGAAKGLIMATRNPPEYLDESQLGAEGDAELLSFTAGSEEAVKAVLTRAESLAAEGYEMRLNLRDFRALVETLLFVAQSEMSDTRLTEWADSFLSVIAATLRVECI